MLIRFKQHTVYVENVNDFFFFFKLVNRKCSKANFISNSYYFQIDYPKTTKNNKF